MEEDELVKALKKQALTYKGRNNNKELLDEITDDFTKIFEDFGITDGVPLVTFRGSSVHVERIAKPK